MIDVHDMRAHLRITTDEDDAAIRSKLSAAKEWVAAYTGFEIDAPLPPQLVNAGTVDLPEMVQVEVYRPNPAAIDEAVRQLTAHLYENREASLIGITAQEMPFGMLDLLASHRAWAF